MPGSERANLLRLARSEAGTAAAGALGAALGAAAGGPTGAAIGAAVTAAGKLLVSPDAWEWLTHAKVNREERAKELTVRESEQLFDDVFGHLRLDYHTPVRAGSHPDNLAGEKALLGALGMLDGTAHEATREPQLTTNGNIVLFGGPNSTRLTSVAWEFQGTDSRVLVRPTTPILPLRFYGLSDATDRTIAMDYRIGWHLEGVGPRATVNWPYIDTRFPGRRYRPEPDVRSGRQITVGAEMAYLPRTNYLLVTRLPNFMVRRFDELAQVDPTIWPHMLVIEGNHGLGTRAAQLLVDGDNIATLREVRNELKSAHAFQVLFRVSDLDIHRGDLGHYHRFHSLELIDKEVLDHIPIETYQSAHDLAVQRLEREGYGDY